MTDLLAAIVVYFTHGVPVLAIIALSTGEVFPAGLLWAAAGLTAVLLGMFVHAFNRSFVPYDGATLVRYVLVLLSCIVLALAV